MKKDLSLLFGKLISSCYIKYRSCLGERTSSGIRFKEMTYPNEELFKAAVDKYILEGCNIINESLNKEQS